MNSGASIPIEPGLQLHWIFQSPPTVKLSVFFAPLPVKVCVVCHVPCLPGACCWLPPFELPGLDGVVVELPLPPLVMAAITPQSTTAPTITPAIILAIRQPFFFFGGCTGCCGGI